MEEIIEIILQAIDNASDIFGGVTDSAEEMGSTIADGAETATSSFDSMDSELQELQSEFEEATNEVERLKEELEFAEEWGFVNDVEELESQLAEAESRAEELAEAIANIDSSGIEETSQSSEELADNFNEAAEAVDGISSLMAFQAIGEYVNQLADAMWNLADKAGTVSDSWTRIGLAAEGAGIPIDQMKSSVSSLAEETGRAGGSIRESFISMASAGVTELSAMEDVFKGASAQAFILGTDVESLTNKFAGMAMKSTLAERTLKGTGITVEELGQVLGIQGATIDDVNAKWETMDVNARAAALGQAAAMNEGKDANDAYKNSWEGLQAQIDIAKGKLEVVAGKVLLPVLIPALKAAGDVLSWFGDTISWIMDSPLGGFISVIGSAAAGLVLLLAGITAIKAGMGFFAASLMPAITASWGLLAPWLPFIAIGAAIVLIIYEIGKAFGWWTDASSMIDAIGAGLQRLWNAFINHPDVQAAISAISSALSTLWEYLQQAGQAVLDFFGINSSGNFNIVRALIDGIGHAWDSVKSVITTVITVIQTIWSVAESIYNGIQTANESVGEATAGLIEYLQPVFDILSMIGEFIIGEFMESWNAFVEVIGTIITSVGQVVNIFKMFMDGQISLSTALAMIWNVISSMFATVLSIIISRVISFAGQLLSYAVQAGSNFLNGIVTWLSQLPGRVASYMSGALSRIISIAGQWVSNAKSKASSLVSTVASTLSGLPGRISSALSGVVNAITKPFRDAYNQVKKIVDDIVSLGGNISFGGEPAYGGEVSALDVASGQLFDVRTGEFTVTNESKIQVEVDEKVTLDLVNVPAHIDTATLIKMLQDKDVLKALTGNKDFQELDNRIKEEILAKTRRENGGI